MMYNPEIEFELLDEIAKKSEVNTNLHKLDKKIIEIDLETPARKFNFDLLLKGKMMESYLGVTENGLVGLSDDGYRRLEELREKFKTEARMEESIKISMLALQESQKANSHSLAAVVISVLSLLGVIAGLFVR